MPQTIDVTPTWSGLLPALLDAYANVKRQLSATECDGHEDGWCSVHNGNHDDTPGKPTVCEVAADPAALAGWKQGLDQSYRDIKDELAKAAKAADRYNAIVNATKAAPAVWGEAEQASIERILREEV